MLLVLTFALAQSQVFADFDVICNAHLHVYEYAVTAGIQV